MIIKLGARLSVVSGGRGGAIIPATPLCFCRHRASAAYKTCEGDKQRVAASAGQPAPPECNSGSGKGLLSAEWSKNKSDLKTILDVSFNN